MRREIPLAITFISGFLLIVAFFIPHDPFSGLEQNALVWLIIISGFAMLLGIDSLLKGHIIKIQKKVAGWGYSLVLILSFLMTFFAGLYTWLKFGHSILETGSPFLYIYQYFQIPLSSTMFALLSFFIASAAYRAFRARNLDATFLLITAVIVMLGRVPVAEYGVFSKIRLAEFATWIMEVPQMAAKRGILLGISFGMIAMSLRILLGIERTYLR
jgi:hypothetical protein